MKKTLVIVVLLGFSQIAFSQSKKELKEEKATQEYQATKELINSKQYVFDADWVSTTRGIRVNIAGGSNRIAVVQDSAKASLQFFGEVTSIRFDDGEGVEFNNKMEGYEVKYNDEKRRITVSFKAKFKSETYNIYMSITKSGTTYVDVNSNNKRSVTYEGKITAITIE
ncbi:MAG: DUF4251 domain-containing protein [Flavobacteriaceae bacterium]|nr:DUF4251 domain-containing protein [Flavobacteriaceae bacterium]